MIGLQVFDENGNCTLNTDDRVCKVLGVVETGYEDGFIVDDNLTEGDWWILDIEMKLHKRYSMDGSSGGIPRFFKEGNKLKWTFVKTKVPGRGDLSRKVLYGVY